MGLPRVSEIEYRKVRIRIYRSGDRFSAPFPKSTGGRERLERASKHDFGGPIYRLSIQQGVSMGRRSDIEAEAHKRGGVVTSVSVGGATIYIASGEIEVPPSALLGS